MRKTVAALLALFVLTFVSGCGASGGDDASDKKTTTTEASGGDKTTTTGAEKTTTTESSGGDVDVDEWAKGFCGSFEAWIAEIQGASGSIGDSITPGDIQGAKDAIVGLFETASSETQSLIADLESGGTPDVDDGAALVDDLIGKFQDFDDAISAAKSDAEGLPVDDPTAFQSEVTTLVATFQTETTKVGESFSELDTKYPSPALNKALTSSCNL